MAYMWGLSAAMVAIIASTAHGAQIFEENNRLIPKAQDQTLTLEYNAHPLSGIPETYLLGKMVTSGDGLYNIRYELMVPPSAGEFGWNNTLSGEFIYSPRKVNIRTDEFTFRAVNDFGTSNWAKVEILIEHNDKPSGGLQVIVLLAVGMMVGTVCGMLRTVSLQLLLVPTRSYNLCGTFCGFCCAPPEVSFAEKLDYKPDFISEEDMSRLSTLNPVQASD